MLIRLSVAAVVLLHLGTAIGQGQDARASEPQETPSRLGGLFGRVLARSTAGAHLTSRIEGLAKQYKVSGKNIEQITSSMDGILADIGNEIADDYENGDEDAKSRVKAIISAVRTESESLELTKAWQKAVKSVLSDKQFESWKKDQAKRHATILKKINDQAKQRQVRIQPDAIAVRGARMIPARPIAPARLNSPAMFRTLLKRYRSSFEQTIKDDITRLVTLCGLDEKQIRRLEVARKGAVSKTFDGFQNQLSELEQNGGEVSEALRTRLSELRKPDQPFWKKAIQSTLTEEQRKTLAMEEKRQADFRKVAFAYQLTAYFDDRCPLADKQRVRILEILAQASFDGRLTSGSRISVSRWSTQLPGETVEAIEKVLSPGQRRAVQPVGTAPRPPGALAPFRPRDAREVRR